jgi:16S rRNA (adenine1518-N6/adenine1519-N6)-dimethyltransferase
MYRHHFKKSFGQNFLKHDSTAKRITQYANPSYKNIIEIGPGQGKLTRNLLETGYNVFSVEIDAFLYQPLETKFEAYNNFSLIRADILEFNIEDLNLDNYSVIGSLPYNISKKIIEKFLWQENQPKEMIFLIQKEVADDYVAKPPKATFLSNFASLFGDVEYLDTIKKSEFYPEPKVDGAVLKFSLNKTQPNIALVKFIKNGFRNPRKTVVNTLRSIYKVEKDQIEDFLAKNDLTKTARASELSIKNWESIYNKLQIN